MKYITTQRYEDTRYKGMDSQWNGKEAGISN
jgi:hypothetical protein